MLIHYQGGIMENQQQKIIFANPHKSLTAAILLSVILGPIGLLYSSFVSSLIMTILFLLVMVVSAIGLKLNVIYMLLWVISIFLSASATIRYNKKIDAIILPELGVKKK